MLMKSLKTFTSIFSACLVLVALLAACNTSSVQGSGNITSQEIPITNYNQIELDATINLVYEAKPEASAYLTIEGDDNLISLIEVKINNGKLEIKQKKNINPTQLTVYTNSPSLKSIDSRGVTDVYLKGSIAGDEFSYEQRGAGNLKADNLVFSKADFKMRGTGDITLAGAVNKALYELAGNGNFRATEMKVTDLNCDLKGNGYMQVAAEGKLSVEIRGSGNVEYTGSAQLVKQEIKGVGSITKI